jgi:hypothetical protein
VTYKALCCGARVIGRLVWIALGVPDPEEHCPECGRWTKFEAEAAAAGGRGKKAA